MTKKYKNLSNEEIRVEIASKFANSNGQYITEFCIKCETCRTAPEGDTKRAKILLKCKNCFEPIEKKQ